MLVQSLSNMEFSNVLIFGKVELSNLTVKCCYIESTLTFLVMTSSEGMEDLVKKIQNSHPRKKEVGYLFREGLDLRSKSNGWHSGRSNPLLA